jgi:predicted dehydrogenase
MDERSTNEGMNRRTFLCSAATTGAGLAFSPAVFAETSKDKKPDPINVALLGAGGQGRVLANGCLKIPGVRFKAVCDIWEAFNQKRVSRILGKYGHEHNTYVDYKEMLNNEKDLDAVIIATPDFWHAKQTVDCLDAGLHVYCETAMSNTIEGARKMVEASNKTGNLLQIGCQRRSNPSYLHCYEKLIKANNVLGRMAAVSSQWNTIAMQPLGWPQRAVIDSATLKKYGYESMAKFRNWRWYQGLGSGPVVSHGSHQIDIFNWFLEANPTSIMAGGRIAYLDKKTHQWYDTVMVTFEYETDQGSVSAHYQILSHNRNDGYFEKFMGDKGTLVISESSYRNAFDPELMNSTLEDWVGLVKKGHLTCPEITQRMDELTTDQLAKLLVVKETPPGWRLRDLKLPARTNKPLHQPHLENFFDAIRGKVALNCPAEIGFKTAVAVLKINEAIEAGRKISFLPDDFNA